MTQTRKQILGHWGEDQASLFLIRQGYEVIERNFFTRQGEIDIIGWCNMPHFGRTLCFIEVKTRSSHLGSAERATGRQKLSHLFHAAKAYCLQRRINMDSVPIQFEQVSVYVHKRSGRVRFKRYVIPVL